MRHILLITIIAFSILSIKDASAQAGSITTGGVYVPRVTTTARDAISNPTNGQMIYNIDDDCFNVYQSNEWQKLYGFDITTPGKWTQKANPGGGERSTGVGFSIGNKGYFGVGSSNGGGKNDFWEYNPANNIWTQKADFPGVARNYGVGFPIGSKGYIGTGNGGGGDNDDFWEYNPADNTWTQKADFGGGDRREAVGFSIGDKGYIGTGYGSGVNKNDFWEYNPANNTWTQKADFAGVARSYAVGFSIGSKGYIGIGYANSTTLGDFWEYDSGSNVWVQKQDFEGTRALAVGFSIGSKGYIGTGFKMIGSYIYYTTDFWEYNPVTNDWTQKIDVGGGSRIGAIGFSIGSKGYIGVGGDDNTLKNDFWEYNPKAVNFTEKGNTFNGANQLVQTDGTGKVPALVLPANTTTQGNTFNGLSQLVKTDGTGKVLASVLPANTTIQGNAFNGPGQLVQTEVSGIVPTSILPSIVTIQGNTFNEANQLIKLDATGNLTINGNISNQSYVAPTLQNGWINYIVSPGHAAAGYYKDKESIVRLKGLIRGGTTTSSTVLFTLPVGYRPAEIMIFAVVNGNAFGRVDVYPSGEVRILSGGNDFLSLDNITFRVN